LLAAGLASLALPRAAGVPWAAEPVQASPAGGDLIRTALLAGGMSSPATLAARERRFAALAEDLQSRLAPEAPPRKRIATVFAFLQHEALLGNYRQQASDIELALDGGDYNCVSATILFVALAQRAGLQPQIWHAPGHVFCRFPGESLEIETTCRDWLSASRPRPPRPGARRITSAHLVAKLDYNRGILLLEQGRFAPALAALRRSCAGDPLDRDARQNLLAGLNNAALAECAAGRFAPAAALLAEVRDIDPDYAPLRVNDVHLHQKWVLDLCVAGRFAAALELLERGYARRPDVPLFASGRQAVAEWWARSSAPPVAAE
jgi:tetratricopeptide (TPR) repeat protein